LASYVYTKLGNEGWNLVFPTVINEKLIVNKNKLVYFPIHKPGTCVLIYYETCTMASQGSNMAKDSKATCKNFK